MEFVVNLRKKVLPLLVSISACLQIIGLAAANETDVNVRVIAGYMDYELTLPDADFDPITGQIIISDSITGDTVELLGLGLALDLDDWFFDLYYQESGNGKFEEEGFSAASNDAVIFDPFSQGLLFGGNLALSRGTFSRTDYSASIGRRFENGFNVAIGYKVGETNLERLTTSFNIPEDTLTGIVRVGGAFSTNENDYEAKGPFISTGFGREFGIGALAVNAAIAFLDASNKSSSIALSGVTAGFVGNPTSFGSGDATGLTLGIAWLMAINDSFGLKISADYYSYDFDLDLDGDTFLEISEDAEAQETATSFKVELNYTF